MKFSFFKAAALGALLAKASFATELAAPSLPWETSAVNWETGVLWEIGTGTPIAYRIVPVQLSWRSPKIFGWEFGDGSRVLVRHRLTLLGDWIQRGPESHYVGFSGSPSVEWWNRSGDWSVYGGAGGGFGVIDSRGVKGGQGQDFTLNWFLRGGVEHVTAHGLHLTAGIMYQHMSNGGQTKPNPGIDALGFLLGGSWRY